MIAFLKKKSSIKIMEFKIKTDFSGFHGNFKKWSDNFIPTKKGHVGIFDPSVLKYAYAHEYGVIIKPKKATWLTIPAIKEAKGKKSDSFSDLFFYKKSESLAFMMKRVNDKNIAYYILKKEIEIPERSFMRKTLNSKDVQTRVYNLAKSLVKRIINGEYTMDKYIEMLAIGFSMEIKQTIYNGVKPDDSALTLSLKAQNKPLMDSRKLVDSITHIMK